MNVKLKSREGSKKSDEYLNMKVGKYATFRKKYGLSLVSRLPTPVSKNKSATLS